MFEDTRTAAEKYDAAMQHLEEIKKAGLVSDDTYQRQLKKLAGEYGQTQSAITGLTAKLDDFVKKTEDMGTGLGDALVGAFESGGDAVAEFVRTGKLDIASLVTSMLADFARLSAEKAIFGPLAQLLSGALSGGGGILTNWLGGSASASVLHDGGMAGSAGARRAVPAGIFATAPRFHSGGWPGLRSDEVPAILQRDERVQSRAEVRAGRGGGVVNITIMARDAASFRQSQAQISADIARAVAAGRRSS